MYHVRNEQGCDESLEVTAESELGFHVKITTTHAKGGREYRDFISRNLFEALLKSGYLIESLENVAAS